MKPVRQDEAAAAVLLPVLRCALPRRSRRRMADLEEVLAVVERNAQRCAHLDKTPA